MRFGYKNLYYNYYTYRSGKLYLQVIQLWIIIELSATVP